MEQINIYDLFTDIKDPVYEILSSLKIGEAVEVEDLHISLNNHGLYELSSESCHESFKDISKCYRFICDKLVG